MSATPAYLRDDTVFTAPRMGPTISLHLPKGVKPTKSLLKALSALAAAAAEAIPRKSRRRP